MRITVLLVLLSGCLFETNTGSDCLGDGPEPRFVPDLGACVDVGDADACQFCGDRMCVVADPAGLAQCGGPCTTTDETACLGTQGCIATYVAGSFASCWSTAPSGPVHSGACAGLDARDCSRHDNCSAWYGRSDSTTLMFQRCVDEPAASGG